MKKTTAICFSGLAILVIGAAFFLTTTGYLPLAKKDQASKEYYGDSTTFNPGQVQSIEKIVHNYLVTHPEVLIEATKELQKRAIQARRTQTEKIYQTIAKHKQDLFHNPGSPVLGNPNGTVTIVEFMDYQCGHCKDMGDTIRALTEKNKNVKVIIKDFPIFGENSEYAAKASLASMKQNKFAAFHKALLATSGALSKEKVLAAAQSVGLNLDQLQTDINSEDVAKQMRENSALASALNLQVTPVLIFSNQAENKFEFVPGGISYSDMMAIIKRVSSQSKNKTAN